MMAWEYEQMGEWTFRVRRCRDTPEWIAHAKRGSFMTDSAIFEPGDLWFEFGATRNEALSRLKAELLN